MSRTPDHPVAPQFIDRWSPRAFDGSELSEETMLSLFEAARWAPSAYNYQPWRFVWSRRGDAAWEMFTGLLVPGNAIWAAHASALIFILSDKQITVPGASEPKPSGTASFDTGAAWASLAFQAHLLGLQTHAMVGFDHARAREELGAGDRFKVEAAVAIGRMGDKSALPEGFQAREAPSPRKALTDFVFPGRLPE